MTPPISAATLDALIAFAERLADESRLLFAPNIGLAPRVEVKADRSLVTALDKAIEERLRNLIEQAYPAHGIYGEEEGHELLDAEYVGVVDPIEGTAPFIAGVPVFGTLIALMHRGAPVLGVMDLPVTQDRWVGAAGRATAFRGSLAPRGPARAWATPC